MADYDVVIIGAGPGGYVAAIRAAQLGLKTALVEKEKVGGVCLNWGCIPTKALLQSAEALSLCQRAEEFGISLSNLEYDYSRVFERSRQIADQLVKGIQFLLKKNRVEVFSGHGRLMAQRKVFVRKEGQEGQTLTPKNVIVATGARPTSLPSFNIDGKQIITSREALELKEVPRSLVIIGAGAIGVELAYLFCTFGAKVTLVEMLPHLLPGEDEEISELLEKSFNKKGIKTLTGRKALGMEKRAAESGEEKVVVRLSSQTGEEEVVADKVLVAIGVKGNVEEVGAIEVGVRAEKGFFLINERMATNIPSIYAIGDVTGPPLLAHVASAQGLVAVESIAGQSPAKLNYSDLPRAVYCQPQVASLGLTEAESKKQGRQVKVGRFPFRASGKAQAEGEIEGMVKLVVDAEEGEILGAHIIGAHATESIAELGLAKTLEATNIEVGRTVHCHPTLSEAVMEAALAADGQSIHI
jgi:dihydrolipoamide dehydrogenase